LSEHDLHHLQTLLKPLNFAMGDLIIQTGNAPDHLYFLTYGEVSVSIPLAGGGYKRVATLSAGMAFGEMALIERSSRSADVFAATPVECYALSVEEFDCLQSTNSSLQLTLLTNLLRHVSATLRRLTREVSVLTN